ncbi:hypothetical protein JCM24511_04692 [Saitozyma sp. JCM 24511]|nr:hypothetical protein JCM24511_04692 [Saitozyma sp. JCM 24511]
MADPSPDIVQRINNHRKISPEGCEICTLSVRDSTAASQLLEKWQEWKEGAGYASTEETQETLIDNMSVLLGNKDRDDDDVAVAEGSSSVATEKSFESGARPLLDRLIAYEQTGYYKSRVLFERVAHKEASRLLGLGQENLCAVLADVLMSIQQETDEQSDLSAVSFSRRVRQNLTEAFPGMDQTGAIGDSLGGESVNEHRLTTCDTCRKVIEGYKSGKRTGLTQDLEDLLRIIPPLSEMAKESPWISEVERLADDTESNSEAYPPTAVTELHDSYMVSKATLERRRHIEQVCSRQATKLLRHPGLCSEGRDCLNALVAWTASSESYSSFLGRAEQVLSSVGAGEEGAPSASSVSTAPTE